MMAESFVVVPQRRTLRRIVSSSVASVGTRQRRQPVHRVLRHLARQAHTASWIVLIICFATKSAMSAPVRHHRPGPSSVADVADASSSAERRDANNEQSTLEEAIRNAEAAAAAAQLPVRSTSVRHVSGDRFRDVRPKWVNPCGGMLEDVTIDSDAPPLTDAEIAANTILEVDLALNQIRSFKDDFVRSLFRMEFDEMVSTWARVQYDWLPAHDAVPKAVGAKLSRHQLQSLDLGTALKKVYLAAQTIAVGLEQVILDRAVYGGDYLEQFADTENKLAMVLCSLQMAMLEKRVEPDADAARQLMSNEYRDMRDASGRNFRDFIIMRDYINTLEYVQQVLHHFQNNDAGRHHESSSSS